MHLAVNGYTRFVAAVASLCLAPSLMRSANYIIHPLRRNEFLSKSYDGTPVWRKSCPGMTGRRNLDASLPQPCESLIWPRPASQQASPNLPAMEDFCILFGQPKRSGAWIWASLYQIHWTPT